MYADTNLGFRSTLFRVSFWLNAKMLRWPSLYIDLHNVYIDLLLEAARPPFFSIPLLSESNKRK
jgi:hypothetical protein